MSSTTTHSEDKLYLTEDLEGRLNLTDLEGSESAAPYRIAESMPVVDEPEDFYATNLVYPFSESKLPPPIRVSIGICYENADMFVLDGSLQSLSFGHEGWLCTTTVDANLVPTIVLKAAKMIISHVQVTLPEGSYQMFTNVDCTATFSYGSASFTVTSDEARYV